jgi:Flp pilus assembly protein TadG
MDFLSRRRPDDSRDGKRRERRQLGVASVEMIAVLPVLFLLLFGTIDFGLLFREWLVLGHSARVAARTATRHYHPCNAGTVRGLAEDDGRAALAQAGVDGGVITLTGSLCARDRVTATASANYQTSVLGVFVPSLNTIPISASVQMRGEY